MKNSWWVVVFLGCGSIFYFHGMWKKEALLQELRGRMQALQQEKHAMLAQREELSLQILSERDPTFVEMTLKKELGMVPDGQTKVYFKPQ